MMTSAAHLVQLLAAGITTWIMIQAYVNIGAVLGVLPITGVPLPFADPSCGAGVVASQLIRLHSQRIAHLSEDQRCSDTLKLIEGLQLMDSSDIAVEASRRRILITLGKAGLVDLSGDSRNQMIGRSEAQMILRMNLVILSAE